MAISTTPIANRSGELPGSGWAYSGVRGVSRGDDRVPQIGRRWEKADLIAPTAPRAREQTKDHAWSQDGNSLLYVREVVTTPNPSTGSAVQTKNAAIRHPVGSNRKNVALFNNCSNQLLITCS